MKIIEFYNQAKQDIIQKGYKEEIYHVESLRFEYITPLQFFDQYVFVVLSSGMKNQVAEKIFWNYRKNGIDAIKHPLKKKAIREAEKNCKIWFKELRDKLTDKERLDFLETLPHIGKITKYHLARNLGVDCAKPDRHLVRLAERFGYSDVQQMCKEVSNITGDRIGTVDVVLWRYSNLN